jgi:PIN domain nuclease of toxin-antitoxin system
MKVLLDTHVFLWWLDDPKKLAPAAATAIGDPQNRVLISIVSLWINLQTDVTGAGFELLPLEVAHIVATESLPLHHRDPFDRMLVAQAIAESATVVTRDPNLTPYGVPILTA